MLLTLINDLLDFSKIEAGKLDLETIEFHLPDLVNGVLQLLKQRAQSAGLRLLAKHPVPDCVVSGDPARLRQVLMNLVGNAIKFTEQGHVTVTADEIDSSLWRFSVEDTGNGIPIDKQKIIFEAFTQADRSTARRFGGTGLGLAISARLVEAMNGHISVESEPGRGTVFHFTVPLGGATDMAAPIARDLMNGAAISCPTCASLRVLLVEDNQVNQKVATAILKKRGHRVTVANNGLEGLTAISNGAFDASSWTCRCP